MIPRDLQVIFKEIADKRDIELGYKGTFSHQLYFMEIGYDGSILSKVPWMDNSRRQLKDVINIAIADDSTNMICLGTEYDDWRVNIFEEIL